MRKVRWITLGVASVLGGSRRRGGQWRTSPAAGDGRHIVPGRLPDDPGRVARDSRPRLRRRRAREARQPVIFLHGNNDTPFPTSLQCGCGQDPRPRPGVRRPRVLGERGVGTRVPGRPVRPGGVADEPVRAAHTTAANVDDLARFVKAVLAYTGAKRVDIVGHSLGGTLAREWMRRDHAHHLVRHLVTIASPHHGITDCSPSPLNYFALDALGGFNPESAICVELGAADTPFLTRLNRKETPGPTKYLALRNADADFVYISAQDGPFFPPVPAQDRNGNPHDFSASPALAGKRAKNVASPARARTTRPARATWASSPRRRRRSSRTSSSPRRSTATGMTSAGAVGPRPRRPLASRRCTCAQFACAASSRSRTPSS